MLLLSFDTVLVILRKTQKYIIVFVLLRQVNNIQQVTKIPTQ